MTEQVLRGSRVTSFRVDVLTRQGALVGELDGVVGGSLSWSASASVKGSGVLQLVRMPATPADWLQVRLRVVAQVWEPDGAQVVEEPLGVFLPATPVQRVVGSQVWFDVELLDKSSILAQDVIGAPVAVGAAGSIGQTYVIRKGFNIVQAVKNIIAQSGEDASAIVVPVPAKLLPADMVWEAGTTRLQVINDLLDVAGWFSLWCDADGRYRTSAYVEPKDRVPPYEALAPFTVGPTSLMGTEVAWEHDIYAIPNRVLVIGQGDSETPALKALATNTDPASPYSSVSRGRWVTHVETGVEAASQRELDLHARRRLAELTSVTSTYTLTHLLLPRLTVNSTVRLRVPQVGADVLGVVTETKVPLAPLSMSESVVRRVVG